MTAQELARKEKLEIKEAERTRPGHHYLPDVDILEDQQTLRVIADMPGVMSEGLHVDLDKDVLTVSGEVATDEYRGLTPVYTEYNVGHFLRRFALPGGQYDMDGVKARLVDGVLEVTLPKSERARPRRIRIED